MSESFVDLTYRGLVLGNRVKLTQVRPSTGYLELPTPMPVGTSIAVTSEGAAFDAMVIESIEQVSGRDGVPGMTVRPRLEGDAVTWWKARIALPDLVKPEAAPVIGIVRSKRASNVGAVPELVDDGRNTAVQQAIDPATLGVRAETDQDQEPVKDTQVIPVMDPPIVDDGRRTIAMDAVDLAALGLDASISGQIPVAKDDEEDDDKSDPKSGPGGKKKRRRR